MATGVLRPGEGSERSARRAARPALPPRAVIAAEVRLYRDGLRDVLSRGGEIDVVGVAGSGGEMVALVEELRPDVVLLDVGMPERADAIRAVVGSPASPKVLALAAPETEAEVIALAEAGVSGYVTRDDSLSQLSEALQSLARGELLCSPLTAATLLRRVASLAAERRRLPTSPLTRRELEVARLIDQGLSNKEIGRRLCIEVATVKNHVHHILEKLGVTRRGEAVARLRQRGLIDHAPA